MNEKWLDLRLLTGRPAAQIPDALHPMREGFTLAQSLAAATGVHPNSGGLYDPRSMAAVCGGVNKNYLVNSIFPQPEFAAIVHRTQSTDDDLARPVVAVQEDALRFAWGKYSERRKAGQQQRAKASQSRATKSAFYGKISV